MSVKADLLFPIRSMAIWGIILLAFVMFVMWMWRRPLSSRTYQVGIVTLVLISLLPMLPRIDNGYKQTYFLNDQRYEIPWQYSPFNGSDELGGRYFLIEVSLPDLAPRYSSLSDSITIGKAVDVNSGQGGDFADGTCVIDRYNFQCEWQRGDFFYSAFGDATSSWKMLQIS